MSDCVLTTATIDVHGYGVTNVLIAKGTYVSIKAHRFAYEMAKGPIPEGLSVLHTCDVRACINPDHLWVGTRAENQVDMQKKGRGRNGFSDATHCIRGHEFTPENTYVYPTNRGSGWGRMCKACQLMRQRRRRNYAGTILGECG